MHEERHKTCTEDIGKMLKEMNIWFVATFDKGVVYGNLILVHLSER